jgi:hypothetical protein
MAKMRRLLTGLIVLTVLAPRAVLACPVCFGESDAPLAEAMNRGVIAMLVVVVGVLSGFAAFIVHLARRARSSADVVEPARQAGTVPGLAGHVGSNGSDS